MTTYDLIFESDALRELDAFALLCRQDYNYGGNGKWFSDFRGGLYGAYNRINGINDSYKRLHSWLPIRKTQQLVETNLANLFFNMDSCLECHVYFLNAIGYCKSPTDFHDITDETALRRISIHNIIGNANADPLDGYVKYFPNVVDHWQTNETLLDIVIEQHDVSKHRRKNYVGGELDINPPDEFLSAFGGVDDFSKNFMFHPMKKILLEPNPKIPASKKPQYTHEELIVLEDFVPKYVEFVTETGALALKDARTNIDLQESQH